MTTLERLAKVVNASLGAEIGASDLTGVARLDEIVAIDSIGLLEVMVGLETEFGTRFDTAQYGREFLTTLDQLVPHLEQLADRIAS
jgi:acyl carrier protein